MTPQQRELFRQAVLNCLEAAGTRFGLTVAALRIHLGPFGFPGAAADAIAEEVQYLTDKGFVAEVPKPVSPENRAYRITAQGRDYLAANP